MSLRVLHLDTGRSWRGGQRQVYLLAAAQRARGDEPLIVAPPLSPLLSNARAVGLAASTVRARGDWDLAAAARVARIVRAWQPDIVHAHDARAHAIALTALVRRRGVPLVVTRRMAYPPRGRVKYGPRVTRFIAISRAVGDALQQGGVDPSRIDVVYDGVPQPVIDKPRDWRRERDWPTATVLCGVVGAMTVEKGVGLLADIAGELPASSRSAARLLLLGGQETGPSRIGGIESFQAGFVDDVYPAMAGLDVLWHPAISEGLGTAVIDSMALEVPPVAFQVGGLPELIEHEQSGLLVPPGDIEAFARAAGRLISEPDLRRRLGRAGPDRAAAFSVARMVDGTTRSYDIAVRDAGRLGPPGNVT
jgi:glycosyltransferase involved in cell wall biosynthesis